jgi:hypothetical protein
MQRYSNQPRFAEYNLNLPKTILIANIEQLSSQYYIKRKYIDSFQGWKTIRLLIVNRLEKSENAEAKKMEKEIFSKGGSYDKKGKFIRNTQFIFILDEYIELIQGFKRKYGIDILDKPDDDGL